MDECHLIDMPSKSGEEIAHKAPTAAVLPERPGRRHALPRPRGEELQAAIRVKRHAGAAKELWFVIEGIDMTHAPRAEDLDHPLRPGGKHRGPRFER